MRGPQSEKEEKVEPPTSSWRQHSSTLSLILFYDLLGHRAGVAINAALGSLE
jgi:hypothetical protein